MEIKLILSPNEAAECELPEILVDYTAFVKGLRYSDLDDLTDDFILACLTAHFNLPIGYLVGYKVLRTNPIMLQVSR